MKMKCLCWLIPLLVIPSLTFAGHDVAEKLKNIEVISDVEISETETGKIVSFLFEQPINHHKDGMGTFKQRVFLTIKNIDKPLVITFHPDYREQEELTSLLEANQLNIEQRFSYWPVPKNGDPVEGVRQYAENFPWDSFRVEQFAADYHQIIQVIREKIFPETEFILTGRGYDGQMALYYKYFYPQEPSICVLYSTPVVRGRSDPRIDKHLSTLGINKVGFAGFVTSNRDNMENCAVQLKEFQTRCFEMLPEMAELLRQDAPEYSFQIVGGVENALKLMILEFQYSFWMKVKDCKEVPREIEGVREHYQYLTEIVPEEIFCDINILKNQSRLYTMLMETGTYDYNIKPFKKYFSHKKERFSFNFPFIDKSKNLEKELKSGLISMENFFQFELPEDFHHQQSENLDRWLQNEADKILFIYGKQDPWFGANADLRLNAKCSKYTKADMHHGCRIQDFEGITRESILETLKGWE